MNTEKKVVLGLLIWGLAVFFLAATGFFASIPRQAIAILAVIGIAVPTAIYFRSRPVRDFVGSIGIKALTVFHVWRIGAGLLFVFYGSLGLLPGTFVANAGYGDIAVGVLVFAVLLLPEGRAKYWAFHIAGMADFVVAVGTGLTLVLSGNPLMANLVSLPVVLIPLFGVGISGATHIFAFHLLWNESKEREGLSNAGAVNA